MTRQPYLISRMILANLRLLSAGGGFLIAGILLRHDTSWFVALLLVGLLLLVWAAVSMLRLAQHPDPVAAHPLPSDLPLDQRIAILRRGRWFAALVLLPYSVWVAIDLYRLETGAVEEISLWGPIGDLYRFYGFWPAVSLMPVITIGFALMMILGPAKLRREAAAAAEAARGEP